jgi:hypothetical protein
MQLGIVHQRIAPSSPQQNGQHERMHRELKRETTRPAANNLRAQQRRFDAFRHRYNEDRPHASETPSASIRSEPHPHDRSSVYRAVGLTVQMSRAPRQRDHRNHRARRLHLEVSLSPIAEPAPLNQNDDDRRS